MAAPHKVYARKVWVNLTAEHLAEIQREISLGGGNHSVVMRKALDAYFAPIAKRKRKAAS